MADQTKISKVVDFGLSFIMKLKPCSWNWKVPQWNDGRQHFGFIAQEVNDIAPRDDFGFVDYKEGYFMVNYMQFIAPLVKSVQEQQEMIENLKARLKVAESRINTHSHTKDEIR